MKPAQKINEIKKKKHFKIKSAIDHHRSGESASDR